MNMVYRPLWKPGLQHIEPTLRAAGSGRTRGRGNPDTASPPGGSRIRLSQACFPQVRPAEL